MLPRRGATALLLVVVLTSAACAASCRKKAASDSLDGSASADAAAADAASGRLEGGASVGVDAGDAAAIPASPAEPATSPLPSLPRPTPFTGTYRCFKGMQLEQVGTIVTSTIHKDATTDSVVACTVVADRCTGTVREIKTERGKPPKALHVRPLTLERTAGGDILFKVAASEKQGGRVALSKPGAGEQTFCPRR